MEFSKDLLIQMSWIFSKGLSDYIIADFSIGLVRFFSEPTIFDFSQGLIKVLIGTKFDIR